MKSLSILTFFLLVLFANGQLKHPGNGLIFNDNHVPVIQIDISPEDLEYILQPANWGSDEEFPADLTFSTPDTTIRLENIGFRLRGNTSRSAQKKSFKVSINAFEKGRDLKGLEKFNLNGEHNDPSVIRSKLAWNLAKEVGAIGSRANHIALYINDTYYGVYIHVEHIDEEFIERRFGNKTGNLYKCLWPASLEYRGSDPDEYKFGDHRRTYELKTNNEEDDYSGLAHLIDVLNNSSDDLFVNELENIFDVDSYLRALAVETLIGHWDNHSVNQNNFYLYHNPDDGKFYFITYDLDNTFGVDWFGVPIDWDIYRWYSPDEDWPLAKRVMSVGIYQRRYTQIVGEVLESFYRPDILEPEIDRIKALIQNQVELDTFRVLDYGFSINDFNNSYNYRIGPDNIRAGLKEFIRKRSQSALDQLNTYEPLHLPKNELLIYPNPSNDFIILKGNSSTDEIFNVFNMNGNLIDSFSTEGKAKIYWQHNLSPGMYYLKSTYSSYVGKLVVN